MSEYPFTYTILFDKSKSKFSDGFQYCTNQFQLGGPYSKNNIALITFGQYSLFNLYRNKLKKIDTLKNIVFPRNREISNNDSEELNFTRCLDSNALSDYKTGAKEKARFLCSLDVALDKYAESLKDHYQCIDDFIHKSISDFAKTGSLVQPNNIDFIENCSKKELVVLGDIPPVLVEKYINFLKGFGLLSQSFTLTSDSYSVLDKKCQTITMQNSISHKTFEENCDADSEEGLGVDFFVELPDQKDENLKNEIYKPPEFQPIKEPEILPFRFTNSQKEYIDAEELSTQGSQEEIHDYDSTAVSA